MEFTCFLLLFLLAVFPGVVWSFFFLNRWIGRKRKHNKALRDCLVSRYNDKKKIEKEENLRMEERNTLCVCAEDDGRLYTRGHIPQIIEAFM